ncbi:MAG: HI0074 family nucleotidyltransferase substrate-binding subunit [candidate division KSB1 bacterium]|nr:HI0074 family nucleotidyltransferase substrate-binding subunit [candidate division KSB1 bacterium]MDZ7369092.1 HI0074 family nucleotidyltransferase substrate-binding subunit [candidate division KSB1 bacterium]MDZ7407070.1 HI0074 family nucleotidyltransferase substrate-binding subunit [candidate division KSB1 bacterium]
MSGKVDDSLVKLEAALKRLGEALSEDSTNPLFIDGTTQRFEFVFKLTWKTLKRALEVEGLPCQTPRETLNTAYQAGWINTEELWLQMLDDRNSTSHTYEEPAAMQIYENIQTYYPELLQLAQFLRKRYSQKPEITNKHNSRGI